MDSSSYLILGLFIAFIVGLILLIVGYNLSPVDAQTPNPTRLPLMVVGVILLVPFIFVITGGMRAPMLFY
jgi:uncharacterized BrkB/YihY/UPF0761 family membrane protein